MSNRLVSLPSVSLSLALVIIQAYRVYCVGPGSRDWFELTMETLLGVFRDYTGGLPPSCPPAPAAETMAAAYNTCLLPAPLLTARETDPGTSAHGTETLK